MATITTTQRLISDLTETVPRTTIHSDTDPLFVIDRDGNTGLLTNDQRTDRTTGNPDYRYAVFSSNGIFCDFGTATGLTRSQAEVIDLNNFTMYWANSANQTGQGAVNTSTGTGNGNFIAGTVKLANGTFIFGNTATAIFGSFQGGINSSSDFDADCHYIADYDNITFIKDDLSTAGVSAVQLRSAHPTRSSLRGLSFGEGVLPGFNSALPTFGTQLEGANALVLQITDGASSDLITDEDNWTPHSHLDVTRTSGNSYCQIQRGVRGWFLNMALPSGSSSFRWRDVQSTNSSTIQYATVWQARFKRDDDESDVSTKIRLDNSLPIYAMPATFMVNGAPTSIVTDGNLAENFVNGNTYLIGEGLGTSGTNGNGVAITSTAADRGFRHYAQELNLDSQDLTIGSYTINGSTVFGSEMTGLLTAMDTDYIGLVDVLGAQVTTAEGIATTFVVDNTDKLYQSVKSRYVEDAPDLDFADVVTTPTGSSINFGDNDITWVDGTTESIAINSDGDITVTTEEIVTGSTDPMNPNTVISNGARTNEIVTTGTVALTGIGLNNVDIDAGSVTGYGDLVNSNLTSAGAIALSSSVDYGGATLTATNFTSVPVSLSDVTLVGSNASIAGIDGSAPRTSTNVTWDGVVNFGDTSTGVVHVFNGTTFTSLPTNTAGGGVDFQLGDGDTLMSTFGQATAPTGFTQVFDDLVLTINNPLSADTDFGDVFWALYNGTTREQEGSVTGATGDITIPQADIGSDTWHLSLVGNGLLDQRRLPITYADGNRTLPVSADPTADVTTPAGTDVSVTAGNNTTDTDFRINLPTGSASFGGRSLHNATVSANKSNQFYARAVGRTGVGITFAPNGDTIWYADASFTFGIQIVASNPVSVDTPAIQGARWDDGNDVTLYSLEPGNFVAAIVNGFEQTGVTATTTVRLEGDATIDPGTLRSANIDALGAYGAATGGEDSDISSITDAITAQTDAIVGTDGASISGIKTDTETILDRTQIIIED